MKQIEKIRQYAQSLRLTQLKNNPENLIHEAQMNKPGYLEFTQALLEREVQHRLKTDKERRLKLARLPHHHQLDQYDYNFDNGVTKSELKQLRELIWLEQNYNLILMGPSGVGKTYIAGGLIHDAVLSGYKAYFITMDELLKVIKLKHITSSAMNTYKRLEKCHLLAIDDIMLFPIGKSEAVELFNLINLLHEKASLIITTNKSPKEWAQTLDDEVLATAMLDRILYRCEVLKLEGKSYRMENRKTIFDNQ
jgi:DNA replication protein DnaC